jgi:ABC-type amino acid transport system permease subunit
MNMPSGMLTFFGATILDRASLLQQNDNGAAGCFACGGCSGFLVLIFVAAIALNVALLVWVARDAKARGMDSAVLWMVLVMLTGLIGLVIYLFSRPQGNVVPCAHCGNKRLQASAKCPHCGNA